MATARTMRDSSWIRQAFLVPAEDADDTNMRYFTPVKMMFADSSLGGNKCINPPPQFTFTADIKTENIFTATDNKNIPVKKQTLGDGLGRYYGEAFEMNARYVSMRFGVAKFNSLTTFFTGFYNSDAASVARTGRDNGVFYQIGKAAGFIVPLLSLPLLLINLVGNAWRWLDMKPSSKYYYLKPAMPLYWNAVTSIVNMIAVNKNVVPRIFDDDTRKGKLDNRFPFTSADMQTFSNLLPDIIMEGGGFNVYALATRYQRIARRVYKRMEKKYSTMTSTDDIRRDIKSIYEGRLSFDEEVPKPSYIDYLKKWANNKLSKIIVSNNTTANTGTSGDSAANDPADGVERLPTQESDVTGFFEFLEAELDDGSAFVTFRVDNDSGSTNESFTNSVTESEIAMKINNMSGEARSTQFSLAGGNFDDGIVGKIIGTAAGAVKDIVSGFAAGLQMSGLAALAGNAFVDIPKHWQSSSARLPTMNYSFTLNSPYGDPMSQMLNLYIPLAMIMAGALPLSTGRQSYTSPFLLEAYDRGRAQTRLGIIDSLTITRGVGNLPFDNAGNCMAIDVSFSIMDMSSIMHMPIVQGFSFTNPLSSVFDDDTVFSDYMAVLGSLSLEENIYATERFRLAMTRQMSNMRTWFSRAHAANFIGDLFPARLASIAYTGIVNR